MQNIKKFKVTFDGGVYNGAERYYSSFARAISVARRYINRCVDDSCCGDYPFCDVFYIRPDYSKKLLVTLGFRFEHHF